LEPATAGTQVFPQGKIVRETVNQPAGTVLIHTLPVFLAGRLAFLQYGILKGLKPLSGILKEGDKPLGFVSPALPDR